MTAEQWEVWLREHGFVRGDGQLAGRWIFIADARAKVNILSDGSALLRLEYSNVNAEATPERVTELLSAMGYGSCD